MRYKIEVNSACRGRILNELCRRGVGVQCVQVAGRKVCFWVQNKECADVRAYLDAGGYDYRALRRGLGAALSFLRRRVALLVALVLVAGAIAVCANLVLSVQIDCAPALSEQVRETVLESRPIGQWRSRYDLAALKQSLVAIPSVALASVQIKGVCLAVSIKEELPAKEIVEPRYAPIVATCDCIVTRVVVERGRALVEAGQSVRKGDVLIAPEYLLDKEQDIAVPTEAAGKVYGTVYPTYSLTYVEEREILRPTGRETTYAVISIAGERLGEERACPYDLYETRRERVALDSWLPVVVERVTYAEMQRESVVRPWESAKEQVVAFCEQQIETQMKNNVTILRKWCIINNKGSTYTVRAYAEVEQEVGD